MENKKQTYISELALVVSIVSLIVTIVIAVKQYKENIIVVTDKFSISNIDLENGIVDCNIDVIVANTSLRTASLLRYKVQRSSAGLKAAKEIESTASKELPLTLIQGSAEKLTIYCRYALQPEEILALSNGGSITHILKKCWIGIQFDSAKEKTYFSTARFEDSVLNRVE